MAAVNGRWCRLVLAMGIALLGAACGRTVQKPDQPVFFPRAPELPRVQFLASFRGRKDLEGQSAFNRFVVGEKQDFRIDKPYGIGIHDGKIYVCDTNATVLVFNFKDDTFGVLKGAVGPGKLNQPINISITADGTKYVSDPVRGQVVAYDRNDEYVRAYGSPGNWRPVDAVAYDDRLYVADGKNGVVKVFGVENGNVVRTIGDKGLPTDRLSRPTNLAFDREGYLYVTDVARFQVVKYDRDGHMKATIGWLGDNLGHFARPKGIALDREDRLLAVDASFNNVQVFNKNGRLLMFFGQGGDKPGDLMLPAKIAVDYDNIKYFEPYLAPGFEPEYLILVTNQFGSHPVSVFAYGKEVGKEYPTDAELFQKIEELRKKEQEKLAPPAEAEPTAE